MTWIITVSTVFALLQYVGASDCPGFCECSQHQTDCSSNKLTKLPERLPNTTSILIVKHNMIRKIRNKESVKINRFNLTHLILSDNRIQVLGKKALPRSLMHLDVSRNALKFISRSAMEGLTQLRFLDLSVNRLYSMNRWPGELPTLSSLLLAGNKIAVIGENSLSGNRKLAYLNVAKNRVRSVHRRAFLRNSELRHIQLSDNPLVDMPKYVEFKGGGLYYLELRNCSLHRAPRGLAGRAASTFLQDNKINKLIQENFSPATQSQRILLEHNRVKSASRTAFRGASSVRELSLSYNLLQYIPAFLPAQLKQLSLAHNRFKQIIIHRQHRNCSLSRLDLSHNRIRTLHPFAFRRLPALQTLKLVNNKLQVLSPYAFDNLLNLTSLDLSYNNLIILSYDSFKGLDQLKSLALGSIYGHVMVQGAVLDNLEALTSLDFQSSPFLAHWLLSNEQNYKNFKTLSSIDLSNNGLVCLPNMLDTLPSLKSLVLRENPVRCTKDMSWLLEWMQKSRRVIADNIHLRCSNPKELQGRYFVTLSPSELGEDQTMFNNKQITATEPLETENR